MSRDYFWLTEQQFSTEHILPTAANAALSAARRFDRNRWLAIAVEKLWVESGTLRDLHQSDDQSHRVVVALRNLLFGSAVLAQRVGVALHHLLNGRFDHRWISFRNEGRLRTPWRPFRTNARAHKSQTRRTKISRRG